MGVLSSVGLDVSKLECLLCFFKCVGIVDFPFFVGKPFIIKVQFPKETYF